MVSPWEDSRLLDRLGQRVHYVLVLNQLRGDDFSQLERSGQLARAEALGARTLPLKHLQDAVLRKIDAANASFWSARTAPGTEGAKLGLLERQRLRVWLAQVEAELAQLGV